VGYRLQTRTQNGASGDRKIELLLWPHLDMPPRAGAQTYPTLSNVADFKVRVLDAQGNWQTRWPILTAGGAAPVAIPNGLEVAVTLSSGETVTRMFAMRGSSS
jgi:general secretion pathway protein J